MPSSLFRTQAPRQAQNQPVRQSQSQNPLQQAIGLLRSNAPEEAAAILSKQYPELQEFIAKNRNKPVSQILRENNISMADVKALLSKIR